MKKKIYLQQGDVVLYKESSVPSSAKKVNVNRNSFVIEKGEGIHTHRLEHPQLQQAVLISETEDRLYMKFMQPLELVHEEHGISQIEQGIVLSKVKEREYDYETQEARAVMD